jgi:hypothetical protein
MGISVTEDDDFLDKTEAAALFKISERTLDRLPGLPRIRISERRIVYRRSALLDYINSRSEAA